MRHRGRLEDTLEHPKVQFFCRMAGDRAEYLLVTSSPRIPGQILGSGKRVPLAHGLPGTQPLRCDKSRLSEV